MANLNLGSIYSKIGAANATKTSSILKLLPITLHCTKAKKQKNQRYQSSQAAPGPLSQEPLSPFAKALCFYLEEASAECSPAGKGIKSLEGLPSWWREKHCTIKEIGVSNTPQAIQASQSQIEEKVQDPKYKNLNSYLAGLFEGDGHIWLPNLNTKKKHNPRFCITFGLKNEPLAKKILEIIEYGHIRYKPKEKACVLIVSPVKGLKKIITLINGELRTPAEWCGKSLKRDKLSNSGDALKLLIPNYPLKRVSGWSNHSCMVISHKMIEKEMGYRGSKPLLYNSKVK
jgi:hypothetical protein